MNYFHSKDKSNDKLNYVQPTCDLYYVYHYKNGSVGAIYNGSEFQCRMYVLNHSELLDKVVIMDEEEYNLVRNLPIELAMKYFAKLEKIAHRLFLCTASL